MRTVAFLVAAALTAPAVTAQPILGVFIPARQGQLNLIDNNGATQLRQAILTAYPTVVFQQLATLTPAGLAGCDTVIIAAAAGQNAITSLTPDEQNALRTFVNGGKGAVIFSDNSTFAVDAPAANASLVGPFGVTAAGTGGAWAQVATVYNTSPASPVLNGPFGVVQTYNVGWSGWYPNAASVAGAQVLTVLAANAQPALVEFPPGALASGSGRAVLFSDSTMIFNGYSNDGDRVVALNAIDATIGSVGCGPADVGSQGGLPGADGTLDNNDFIAFITYFFAADAHADFGVAGGLPGHDGQFDNNDFIAFIAAFFDGCG